MNNVNKYSKNGEYHPFVVDKNVDNVDIQGINDEKTVDNHYSFPFSYEYSF